MGGGRRESCFFCKSKVDEVDYKNVNELRRYVSEKGKIRSPAHRQPGPARSAPGCGRGASAELALGPVYVGDK